jgi:hypothetical protein
MTDNYEYNRSMHKQTDNDYSPYADKQSNNYINDINSGVYQNNGLSLVQFDLSSIYNSSVVSDTNDLFVVIPIVMVAAFSTSAGNGTLVTPQNGNVNLLSLKNNFIHLIHQADISINNKSTGEDLQPLVNIAKHFQMLSEMSYGDLNQVGYTLGISKPDNWKSKVYNGSTSAYTKTKSGNGMTNNRPFVPTSTNGGLPINNTCTSTQFSTCVNDAIGYRLGRYTDTTANQNGFYGTTAATIATLAQLNSDFVPTYQVLNTNYMVWYDYAVIKLNTLFNSLSSIGLTRKADIFIRLYLNTGTLNVTCATPNTTTPGYYLDPTNNGFNGSCPFTINYLPDTSGNGGIPANTINITAGLYVAKVPSTTYQGVNLSLCGASHPMPACRCYYSQITVDPKYLPEYIDNNRAKKCIYRTVMTNQYNNITAGANFNQLISSGITHPTGILIVPMVSSQASYSFGDFAYKSPFDTFPGDGHPLSLINLQVTIGGKNILQSVLNYNYENFLEQIQSCEQLTSADFGVNTGLFDQSWWNCNRFYFVNVERSNTSDKLETRNLNISFTNNNNVPIDIIVYTFKSNQLTIDVETGQVSVP